VLNHAGLPGSREPDVLAGWRASMRLLAQAPNVAVKISGLGLRGRAWSVDDNRQVILDVIEIFGTDRAMFASNFPVDGLCGSFNTIFRGFRESVKDLPNGDQSKLFHDNAMQMYRLKHA
jgi:predicted TIM-barrel fold metal-dependent hydrolase